MLGTGCVFGLSVVHFSFINELQKRQFARIKEEG